MLAESTCFFETPWAERTIPARNIIDAERANNYLTTCDPRLKAEQGLEVACQIAEMIRS